MDCCLRLFGLVLILCLGFVWVFGLVDFVCGLFGCLFGLCVIFGV